MANSNGTMAAGQNAVYNAGMNGMPAAGHYSDMQILMQNMEALSGWLQQNREDFLRVQEDLEKVERLNLARPAASEEKGNADTDGNDLNNDEEKYDPAEIQRPTIIGLQRELEASKTHIETLEQQASGHLRLQAQYEEILTQAVDKTRNYVLQQNEYIISLHQHYIALLQDARRETIDAQLIHQAWQTSLSRLDEEIKKAMKAREQEKDPFRRRIAMLQEENRAMREKLGWEKIVHDSDEEDDDAVALRNDRGRPAHVDDHAARR